MKPVTRFLPALAMALACAATPSFADDDSPDSLRELSAQWWQWANTIPAASNPLLDDKGANCMVGQRGPVWFLAGSVLGVPLVRSCTVPANAPLFFPVINGVNFNTPDCGQDGKNLSAAELRAIQAPGIDGATGLSVLLNNRPVTNLRRVRSKVFTTVLPAGDIYSVIFKVNCLVPGQLYSPSIDDGYYVKLRGLAEGTHHLSIKGMNATGFLVDVFYTLNVVKTVSGGGRD